MWAWRDGDRWRRIEDGSTIATTPGRRSLAFTGGGLVKSLLIGCSLVVVLLTVGCGYGPRGSERSITDGAEEGRAFWQVEVTGAGGDGVESCLADPSVASSWQSADMESTHLGLALVPHASEADAKRIAHCLRGVLPGSEVAVRRVGGTADLTGEPGVTGARPVGPDPSATREPGPEVSCDPAPGGSPVQEGEGTTSSMSCTKEEHAPLTREEMMNGSAMPMPIGPPPVSPVDDPTSGVPADPYSGDGTAGRAQRAEPATTPEGG